MKTYMASLRRDRNSDLRATRSLDPLIKSQLPLARLGIPRLRDTPVPAAGSVIFLLGRQLPHHKAPTVPDVAHDAAPMMHAKR